MAEDRKFKWNGSVFENRVSGEIIPEEEPVILFRARDQWALPVLYHYRTLVRDDHHKMAVDRMIKEFEEFRDNNSDRMKEPGITRHIDLD